MSKKTILVVAISLLISILLGPNFMWKLNNTLNNVNNFIWNIERLEEKFNKNK